ncbi:GNAT family N-acetyltransferase [Streptomyces sp. Isolate_219]|uniref:GNAT family N-acetyltransferase n=1 Tax=Streptomyces sp. Isolate_219 TaxID=2950110 RepID=UPI0021C65EE0|nr:GNAT family N-acetyltransferase [Streptomyces sp. Isolate_219]MCR8578835.1 GNAT family N-acetyltransferase [Streptomyces sp. Isolate_219]
MIELAPDQLPPLACWFAAGSPGTAAPAEHVAASGTGRWWADRAAAPRALAVSCAGHVLLRGDPRALAPDALAVFDAHYVRAPAGFLPALSGAFGRIVPWERMLYVHQVPVAAPCPPRGVTVRRLVPEDAAALAALAPDAAWVHASWGGPGGLAASGLGWAAFGKDEVLAVACTYFHGTAYEDIACYTAPAHRRRRLALACVTALCQDVAGRGHTPSWTCSRDNRPSRLLAWTAGFRLAHEYVHYLTGQPVRRGPVPDAPSDHPAAAAAPGDTKAPPR